MSAPPAPHVSLHPQHGVRDNRLADGTRMLSGFRRIRPGARCMLLIWPGLFRLDVTSNEDSQALTLRALGGHQVMRGPATARTRSVMGIDGRFAKLSEFDFELVGSGHDAVHVVVATPTLSVGWAELDCGAVAYLPATWPAGS